MRARIHLEMKLKAQDLVSNQQLREYRDMLSQELTRAENIRKKSERERKLKELLEDK